MLIACPACASEYEIEGVLVGAEGRSVRCAACSETWFVRPESEPSGETVEIDAWEAAALDEPVAPAFAAPDTVIDQPMPPPRKAKPKSQSKSKPVPKRLAVPRASPALAAGVAVFVILPLALLGRATVVRAMPQSAGLFAAVGLPVNLRGVDLREVVAFRTPAEGANPAQLVVEGDLVGIARQRVPVSPLEIEVRDAHGQPLHRWTVPPSRAALEPGETTRFRASLTPPPEQGNRVVVRFTDADSAEPRAKPDGHAKASAAPAHSETSHSEASHAEPAAHAPAADAGHGHH